MMFRALEPENPGQFIPSQFELYLNLMSSSQGTGRQFEMLYSVDRGIHNGGGEVYLLEHPEILKDYHFDYVVFPINEQSLFWDVNAWSNVETKDDVPYDTIDPEWATKSVKERAESMGPLTRQMVDYCRQNPKDCASAMSFFPDGSPSFAFTCGSQMSFFEVKRLREL